VQPCCSSGSLLLKEKEKRVNISRCWVNRCGMMKISLCRNNGNNGDGQSLYAGRSS
jgi:hypothetical protein